jgi:hypothetical protein
MLPPMPPIPAIPCCCVGGLRSADDDPACVLEKLNGEAPALLGPACDDMVRAEF